MNKSIIIVVIAVVALIVVAWLLIPNQPSPDDAAMENDLSGGTDYFDTTIAPVNPSANQSAKEITIIGSNFKFSPNEIKVKQGDLVRVTFKNSDGMHDWQLPQFNAGTAVIQAGQQQTVEFTANQPGQFEYYCSVGNHRQMGMKGTLIIE